MAVVDLSAGVLEYEDTGGPGPVVVLLHGLLMDSSLWDDVVAELQTDHRCVSPTLPLGAHRHAMRPAADLSLPGIARLVLELLDRLDLRDTTLVGNDTGGAIVQLVMCQDSPRIARVVLASCEAFDNVPPGLTGKSLVLAGKLPPAWFGVFMQQLRVKPIRRLPMAFGWLTKRGDATTAEWLPPVLSQSAVRHDAVRVLREINADRDVLVRAAQQLPAFSKPVLLLWARQDRVMPPEHGRRLAELLPRAELVEVEDSYTLIALDQPTEFARRVQQFVAS